MQAGVLQPTAVTRDRRIIERPRLIKLLDETDARTILLLAPAGYGKTTLARQWAKTLQRSIWVGLTPRHRDVAWLAEDIAAEIDAVGGRASMPIREHISARRNPQRAGRELGIATAQYLLEARVPWVVFDDYHEVGGSSPVDEFIGAIVELAGARYVITSRSRPTWATGRLAVYGAIAEIGRDDLAMTETEAFDVLEHGSGSTHIAEQACGWPAAIGLAAVASVDATPANALPEALHRYLAEELFNRAPATIQEHLLALALMGDVSDRSLTAKFGNETSALTKQVRDLGFSSSDQRLELHPLLREFLLEKLLNEHNAEERIRDAITGNLDIEAWDRALELILRFKLLDCVEEALQRSYKPLVDSGRLATLATFAQSIATAPTFPPPSCEVVLAEAALRDGHLELARDVATRVQPALASGHPLASRCAAIVGQVQFLLAEFSDAEAAYRVARSTAQDERDEAEALHGLAQANVFGERPGASRSVMDLETRRSRSPTDFLRFVTANLAHRRLGGTADGLSGPLHLDVALETLPYVEDPRIRTALCYAAAGALTQRCDYQAALTWLDRLLNDAARFDLEFAMPYAKWTAAQIALGQRRFGDTERALQTVEDYARATGDQHHALNARTLRARLLLQTGEGTAAVSLLSREPDCRLIPSWRAEFSATRAIAFACTGDVDAALREADLADQTTSSTEVRVLAQAARTAALISTDSQPALELLQMATTTSIWDPVVCCVRAAVTVADALTKEPPTRELMQELYGKTGDFGLARRAGFRTRSAARPDELLSPREIEVLGLIARGYRNGDISRALFIAPSTTKVHVRHIFEKLGVRTRSEAVARFQMFSDR